MAEPTSEAYLRAILGAVADGVNILGPDARIVLANAEFLRLYGFPAEFGAPGTPLAAFVRHRLRRQEHYPGEDPDAAEAALVAARVDLIMSAGSGRFEETRPDGTVVAVRRERLPDGTLINTYQNITAAKEALRARETRAAEQARGERLSAIASLLAGIAHEINNPLAVVAAQAMLLADEAEGTRMAVRATKVADAAARCGRIVTSLLAAARQTPPKREVVRLAGIIAMALDLVPAGEPAATVEVPADLPALLGDADQLAHLVANLVANARIALAGRPDARLTIAARPGPDSQILTVSDNGPGIPPELRDTLFNRFTTTRAASNGSGIGLALCRTIANSHGGQISAVPTPGGGATFVLELPARLG
jgi:signal transduction histidine kinase